MDDPTDVDLVRLRVHDTPDFLSLVPYLLGYRPHEQLVFVAMERQHLRVTGAVPLAALEQPDVARTQVLAALDTVVAPMVLLACWSGDEDLAEETLGIAETWLAPEQLLDSAVVGPDAWWSRCSGACGPLDELEDTAAAAQAVVAGLNRADSRDEVVAFVAGPGECEAARRSLLRAEVLVGELPLVRWAGTARELVRAGRDGCDAPHGDDWSRLVVLCQDPVVRQELWLAMDRAGAADDEPLWRAVVAACPAEWAVGPLLCLGMTSWLAGSGAVLVACVERLQQLDPWGSGTQLLSDLNRDATPPAVWEQVRSQWRLRGIRGVA